MEISLLNSYYFYSHEIFKITAMNADTHFAVIPYDKTRAKALL